MRLLHPSTDPTIISSHSPPSSQEVVDGVRHLVVVLVLLLLLLLPLLLLPPGAHDPVRGEGPLGAAPGERGGRQGGGGGGAVRPGVDGLVPWSSSAAAVPGRW